MEILTQITPRQPDLIIREISELTKVIDHTREMIRQFPTDNMLKLASQQDEYRKKQLLKELHLSLTIYLYYMV